MARTDQELAADAGVRIELLSVPRLLVVGRAPCILERKDAALLAVLAIEGPTSRARIASLLWPDSDAEAGRNNLRQRLFRLRKLAQADIVIAGAVLRLAPGTATDLAELSSSLEADASAARGELLGTLQFDDCEELHHWVSIGREQWRLARREAIASKAAQLESSGSIALALSYAERLVADEPLLEHAHRRLIKLHYLRGDRAAALAAFERCRDLLKRELRTSPGKETLELAALIERSGRVSASAQVPLPAAVLRPPRVIGRDDEWAGLEHAWAAKQCVLVSGEPGIGKTRLLGDFTQHRSAASPIAARPGDARVPYALLARILRALLASHGPPSEPWVATELAHVAPELGISAGTLQPLRLRQAVTALFGDWAARGLLAVVVDDLHFADEATLELLLALAGAGADSPRWLLGVRSNEVPPRVAEWIGGQDADRLASFTLGPLSIAATEALLASLKLPGLDATAAAPPLHRHTGGNPLFLLETLRLLLQRDGGALASSLAALAAPTQIGLLLERRLEQLSAAALRLARVAALAGQDFSVALAADVLGCHAVDLAEPWRELESAQIIRNQAFAHDLIFEATLRSVPEPIARELHREIAARLAARRAPAARVAHHWQRAGNWQAAGESYAEAARTAGAAARPAEEADLYGRAAHCYERAADSAAAFAARLDSVTAVLTAYPHEQADALTQQLLAAAATDVQRLDALLARANVLLTTARTGEGEQAAREALALARSLESAQREFDAARFVALALAQQQRPEAAIALLAPFEHCVESVGDRRQRYRYWSDLSYMLQIADQRVRCARALELSIDLAQQLDDLGEVVVSQSNLSAVYGYLGQPADAFATAHRACRLRERLGDTESVAAASVDVHVGMFALLVGRYAESLHHLQEAVRKLARAGDTWRVVGENHLAHAYLHLGQTARAQRSLTTAGAEAMATARARRAAIEGRIQRAVGKSGAARFRAALATLGDEGEPLNRMLAELDLSRELGPHEAAELCLDVKRRAEQREHFGVAIKAHFLHIDALIRAKAVDAASTEARAALARLNERRPVDMYLPECWWIGWQALEAAGAGDEARAALAQAVAWINNQALTNVPAEFRDGFLNRNPVNRAILTAAGRRRHG